MSYNRKTTEYALIPNKAIPLDARSHFKDFAEAHKVITSTLVTTVEQAALNINSNKRFYVGQIITTTNSGTWQVVPQQQVELFRAENTQQVIWGKDSTPIPNLFITLNRAEDRYELIQTINGQSVLITTWDDSITEPWPLNTCLIPFSGSGGGGGGPTITIDAQAPLNYQEATGALTLSLNTDSGLAVVNKQLTLSIDPDGGIKKGDNGLYVDIRGTHTTKTKTDSTDDVKINNYTYQII